MSGNVGDRFDRLPATAADREVEGRATRETVLTFWEDRFGVPRETFDGYTLWEKGSGKVWLFQGDLPSPVADVEALGMLFVRTRQEHWKPTTEAVQRFGRHATRNVVVLDEEAAARFAAGEDQQYDWGDWGYVVAAHELAGEVEPIGVGLYVHGELQSKIPKGRRLESVI